MNWFDWFRLAIGIPAAIAVVGLLTVLITDIKQNK